MTKYQKGRGLLGGIAALLLVVLVAAAGAWFWVSRPLDLAAPSVGAAIEPGTLPREVARLWVDAGVQAPEWALYGWFRASGQAARIRAGNYELTQGMSARDLLRMMVRGDERLATVKLIEGWTFKRFRAELAQSADLKPLTATMSESQVMEALGEPGVPAEGAFFPDTYTYGKGSEDLAVLRRARRAMKQHLDAAWAVRDPGTPLRTPQDLLVLASIVEKETGREGDRPLVASVFLNRLRIGMPLQTDPTVIYGLGDAFDGNLRRRDLQADSPYNTYLRAGLPPTPIAMPGKASLQAAVAAPRTKALYFVSRGDGTSEFSESLEAHNRAVDRYQRPPRTR
jgi:UPF0755 protein